MSKKLFVGSLDWGTTEEELQQLFTQFGEIEEAIIIKDKFSGKSKGFGFVTFKNDEDAQKAVEALDGSEQKGRKIVVNVARPPKPRNF
jgi:RNA recognition motif-containing protein